MEEFLRSKLNNYDAGFDESAWEAIEGQVKENNNSLDSLRDNLKGYDAGFNQNAWNNIAGRVQQNNLAYKSKLATKRIAGAAAIISGVLLSGFFGYSFLNSSSNEQIAEVQVESPKPELQVSDNVTTNEIQPEAELESASTISTPVVENTSTIEVEADYQSTATNKAPEVASLDIPSKEITQPSMPKLHIEKNEYCVGEILTGNIADNSSDKYLVRIDNKWIKANPAINYQLNKSGKHNVELYALNEKNKREKIESRTILVHQKVNSDFSYHKDHSKEIPVTHFDVADKDHSKMSWYIGNKHIGSTSSVSYSFINKGKYPVKLVSCDANGCIDSSTQLVRVLKAYNLLATQVFNPEKETWLPDGLKRSGQPFDIRIISAEGNQAFYSQSPDQEWNGIASESGKKAKDGDEFYWVAKVQGQSGEIQEYAGSFIISTSLH